MSAVRGMATSAKQIDCDGRRIYNRPPKPPGGGIFDGTIIQHFAPVRKYIFARGRPAPESRRAVSEFRRLTAPCFRIILNRNGTVYLFFERGYP